MVVNLTKGKPSTAFDSNSIYIEMFTASWCPPCQRSKSFLFSSDLSATHFKKQLLSCLCSANFEKSTLYIKFIKTLELKHIDIKEIYDIGIKALHKISEKKTEDLDVEIINLGIMILKSMKNNPKHDNEKFTDSLSRNIAYFGLIIKLSLIKYNVFIIDVDDEQNSDIIARNEIRSIPVFKLTFSSKTIRHTGAIMFEAQLNEVMANIIFD